MQIGKAFSYPFDDPDWMKKIGIAAAIMLIPLVGAIAIALHNREAAGSIRWIALWTTLITFAVIGLSYIGPSPP